MPVEHTKKAARKAARHLMDPVPNIVAEILFLFIMGLFIWSVIIGETAKDAASSNHKIVHETSKNQKIAIPAQHCLLAIFRDVKPLLEQDKQDKSVAVDIKYFLLWTKKLPGGPCEPPR